MSGKSIQTRELHESYKDLVKRCLALPVEQEKLEYIVMVHTSNGQLCCYSVGYYSRNSKTGYKDIYNIVANHETNRDAWADANARNG
jgi:hypothetical protein